jgi:hypothetical protein
LARIIAYTPGPASDTLFDAIPQAAASVVNAPKVWKSISGHDLLRHSSPGALGLLVRGMPFEPTGQ